MKKLMKMLGVAALLAVVSLSACSDDSSDSCQNGTLEMTVNGDAVTGSSFNNTLLKAVSMGTPGKRMDIRATDSDGRQLIISFSDLTTGTDGNGVTTDDDYIPFDDVLTGTENVFFFTIIDDDGSTYMFTDGTLDITSCDASAKQVSGTFSFSDPDFEVTSGSFTDMCYRIVKN
jgi:hypothetical protein